MRILVLVSIAVFFSLLAFNNITNFESNHSVVKEVLGMESVQDTAVMWRAIKAPWLVTSIYISIIGIEVLISLFCLTSVVLLLFKRSGLFFGFVGLAMALGLFHPLRRSA